ncbi:MAG: transcription termination factor NusA [Coprobacillus sp.]|nr:transcription termination factor NusA [Coprobacillus sp.]
MAVNFAQFKQALTELEEESSISQEEAIEIFKESLIRSFKKSLGGGDDANVRLIFDLDNEVIELYYLRRVVASDDVQDDYLEIDVEDANKNKEGKIYKVGDEYAEQYDVETFKKASVISVKNLTHQKFAEIEKNQLLSTFQNKIGTMITVSVERADEYGGYDVSYSKTSMHLTRKDLIGDEKFALHDQIKVYVVDVSSSPKSGTRIHISRSHEGFLRCLFFDEIHEVYDGTIQIMGISRKAGERSKVSVYTADPNVDPAGACIGPNGSRIQKIVSQLGNGSTKEKIDIIDYSTNIALYAMDALKPAVVVGIAMGEDNHSATCIVRDDALSLAIGRKGVNVRLASQLVGIDLNVITEEKAEEDGLIYKTFEDVEAEEVERKKVEEISRPVIEEEEDVLPTLPQGYVAPQERVYEEERSEMDISLYEQSEKEEIPTLKRAPKVEEVPSEVSETPAVETPVSETVNVKTTTTIEDLEASLSSSKAPSSKSKSPTKKSSKKEETVEKVDEIVYNKDKANFMPIYTDEELAEIEAEEAEEEEEIDYEEYEEYYDEDNR